jgi:hypothetical protein
VHGGHDGGGGNVHQGTEPGGSSRAGGGWTAECGRPPCAIAPVSQSLLGRTPGSPSPATPPGWDALPGDREGNRSAGLADGSDGAWGSRVRGLLWGNGLARSLRGVVHGPTRSTAGRGVRSRVPIPDPVAMSHPAIRSSPYGWVTAGVEAQTQP